MQRRLSEPAGRQVTARDLGELSRARLNAPEPGGQDPRADAPSLQAVKLDPEAVLDLVGAVGHADSETPSQERADRVAAVGVPIATYVRTAAVRFPGAARVRHPVAFVHHAVLKKKPAATYSPRPLRAKYHRR